tara:strand:+ start:785 stop:1249 length:465 start_codon:yes stop_codon:yes gene_type:complete
MDLRFKASLENQLREEIKKGDDMLASDINGTRVSSIFREKMQKGMNEIAQITDTQVLLTSTISLLKKTVEILNDSTKEANISRREQQARVASLKDYYTKFLEIEEIVKAEKQAAQQEEEKEDFTFDEEAKKAQQIRRIGERPEKLKALRNESDS